MNYATKRRLARFLSVVQGPTDFLGLAIIAVFFFHYFPWVALKNSPATGGDMGSHYWPLVTLVEQGLPQFKLRVWNPGNYAGEPHLVHYFPFPYFIMALLSLYLPLATSFNIGTLLPALLLPLCGYFCLRRVGVKFPGPILGAAFSLMFLYNESFSMWGGNFLSLLAGQFAHAYALCFLLLGLGFLATEMRLGRKPVASALCFAALATSHAYVFLGLPFCFLGFLLFGWQASFYQRFRVIFCSGVLALLLSLWWWIPMLENSPWTSPFPSVWATPTLYQEMIPVVIYPVLSVPLWWGINVMLRRRKGLPGFGDSGRWLVWLVPSVAYLGYYFVFPRLGLVDVRIVPQVHLFLCLLLGLGVAGVSSHVSRLAAWFLVLPLILSTVWWTERQITQLPGWLDWNYSGWESKVLYRDLKPLLTRLDGKGMIGFSEGRVMYEHNDLNNGAGTTRVFEMLPYFANRSTLESLYMQANILAPMIYYLQALVSKTPSCPFPNYPCTPYDLNRAVERLRDFGVSQLILVTPELIGQAQANPNFVAEGVFGPWHLFHLTGKASLVETIPSTPVVVPAKDWRKEFLHWYTEDRKSNTLLISEAVLSQSLKERVQGSSSAELWDEARVCNPQVRVSFSGIDLKTDCLGKAHLLKFAYHPSWKADSGDEIFMVSPGYLAVVPSRAAVKIEFGQRWSWKLGDRVSLITCLSVVVWSVGSICKSRGAR